MNYSTIKLLEIINAAVIIIVFGIAMTLRIPARSTSWMVTLIVILIMLVIPLFILEHKCNRKYPQWDRLWKMPPAAIVAFVLLLAVLVIGAFVTDNGVAWMVIVLVFIRLLPDYYYARKYNMDEVHSVEELLQKHPEAESRIRKTVSGE
ncbi:MAG: hypothetical protein E7226_01370 [Clostridiales bacterium]|jgi:L-asparagine transporter-like permease|nr:hypothetical protein [Clostridiales bacterium]